MFDFVSIDFETADKYIPCSLGLTVVENSQVVCTKNWLIKPICFPYFHFYAQQEQDQKKQQQNQQQQQQQNKSEMSKENAQQLLNAIMQDEKNVQDKVKKQLQIRGKKLEKDW